MRYLDHAATTPMRPAAWRAMEPFVGELFGNSSGGHAVSRRAKNALEQAREQAASILGCSPPEIVFTGGGTESDNLAVKGASLSVAGSRADGRPGGVVTSALEHEAVLEAARFLERLGAKVAIAGSTRSGRVDADEMAALVNDGTAVVSLMSANNETGAVQPLVSLVSLLSGRVLIHTDAVQSYVSERIDVKALGVDLLSLAGHKFGGPKGVGLLYVRDGIDLEPVLHGGGQELGRRSGTHNVMGAVGMVAAMAEVEAQRDRFRHDVVEARVAFESALSGVAERTIPAVDSLIQHCHVRLPGVRNETLLVQLDQAGVAASSASACQSGANTVSHVLAAMGISTASAREHLRFSFGWTSTAAEAAEAGDIVRQLAGGKP